MATNFSSAVQSAFSQNQGQGLDPFGVTATAADIFSARNLDSVNEGLDAAMAARDIGALEEAIDKGERALEVAEGVQTAVDVAELTSRLSMAKNLLIGNIPTTGDIVAQGAMQAFPYGGLASALIPDEWDPFVKGADLLSRTVDKVPGIPTVNRAIEAVGSRFKKIPGAGTVSQIAGGLSEFPNRVLGAPWEMIKSTGKGAQLAAFDDSKRALQNWLLQGEPDALEEWESFGSVRDVAPVIGGIPDDTYIKSLPGTRTRDGRWETDIPIQMTWGELRNTHLGRMAVDDLVEMSAGTDIVLKADMEDAAWKSSSEGAYWGDKGAIDPATGKPLTYDVAPIKSGLWSDRLGYYEDPENVRGRPGQNAYKDEHGIWDATTGNLLAAPGTNEYIYSEVPMGVQENLPYTPPPEDLVMASDMLTQPAVTQPAVTQPVTTQAVTTQPVTTPLAEDILSIFPDDKFEKLSAPRLGASPQVQDLIPQVVTKAAPPVKRYSAGGGYWTGIPALDRSRQYAPPRPVPKLETGPTRTFGRTHAARRSELLGRQ